MSGKIKSGILISIFLCVLLNIEMCASFRQCCPPNYYLVESSQLCSDNKTKSSLNCNFGAYILDPNRNENDTFFEDAEESLIKSGILGPEDEFCVSKIIRNGSDPSPKPVALVCFLNNESDILAIILRILMLISIIFLILTLCIYLALPKLRDLQGKCLIAYITCLIASYTTIEVLQTFPESNHEICVIQAAVLYFFMTATFFWNNVINFNIWSSIRNASYKDNPKCVIYMCIWGFGVPLFMVILSFVLENVPGGNHVRPRFGEKTCWFVGEMETWSYFYGPITVLLMLNIFMFIHSFWILSKRYWKSPAKKVKSLKYKFAMYLKLFLIMGITWIFEVISYAVNDHPDSKYFWFLTDCLNCATGIIIFCILVVFRQKVKRGLLERKVCNLPWPKSWANEEIQESSAFSIAEEVELGSPKEKMVNESLS